MKDLQNLKDEINQLDPDDLRELTVYILRHRTSFLPTKPLPDQQTRQLDLGAALGEVWMSDDFFDELPDSFWLGQQ